MTKKVILIWTMSVVALVTILCVSSASLTVGARSAGISLTANRCVDSSDSTTRLAESKLYYSASSLQMCLREKGYIASGQNMNFSVYLYSDRTYDFDLALNSTGSSVDFELKLYDPSGYLNSYTQHNSLSQGANVSIDLLCSQTGYWQVSVVSENGASGFWVSGFDNLIGTPGYGGTESSPFESMTSYDKNDFDRYIVYLERYFSYDFDLVCNGSAYLGIEIREPGTNDLLMTTNLTVVKEVSLDCIWDLYSGNYYLLVSKDISGGKESTSGNYTLIAYRLAMNYPTYSGVRSPLFETMLVDDSGDIYAVNFQNMHSYDVDLEGLEADAEFEIHVMDFLHTFDLNTSVGKGTSRSLDFPWVRVDGTYYIEVLRTSGGGQYCLTVWDLYVGTPSQSGSTSPESERIVSNDAWDLYCVRFDREYSYDIDLTGFSPTADFEICVVDQYMKTIYNSTAGLGKSVSLDLIWVEDSGEHYVAVVKKSGSGSYRLTIWRLYFGGSGVSPENQIIIEEDMGDIYTFRLEQWYSYDVDLTGMAVFSDFEIRVFDLVGEEIYSTSRGPGEDRSLDFVWNQTSGDYYIRVACDAGLGPYRLRVSNLDLGQPSQRSRASRDDLLVSMNDSDIYRIYFYEKYSYDVDLIKFSVGCDFEIQIINAEGRVFYSTSGASQEDRSLDFVWTNSSGYYYVRVYSDSGFGTYELQVWNLRMYDLSTYQYSETSSPEYEGLYSNDHEDIYGIYVYNAYSYEIDLTMLAHDSDFEIELRDGSGILEASTEFGTGADRSLDFIWTKTNDMCYVHIVKDNGVGTYKVTFKCLYLSSSGSELKGNIIDNDAADFFTVDLSEQMAYDLDLRNYPSSMNLKAQIVRADNYVLCEVDPGFGVDASLDFIWNFSSGKYYVKVMSETGRGEFTLRLAQNYIDSYGSVRQEILTLDSCDIWRITLQREQSFDIDLTEYPTSADFELQVMDSTGYVYYSTNSGFGEEVSLDFIWTQGPGNFYLKVLKEAGQGPYKLSLNRPSISPDQTLSNTILSKDDCDIWSVDFSDRYAYDIDLTSHPSSSDYRLQIIDNNSAVIYDSSAGIGQSVSLDFVWTRPSGRYFIKVCREIGQGPYTLTLRMPYLSFSYGGQTQEIIDNDNCDIWSIDLSQNRSYDIDLTDYPSAAGFELQLIAANSTTYYWTQSGYGEDTSLDFVWTGQDGRYYVRVLREAGQGSYTLVAKQHNFYSVPASGSSLIDSLVENDTRDIVRVDLEQGKRYDFELRAVPSWAIFRLRLTDRIGNLVSGLETYATRGQSSSLDFLWNASSASYYVEILSASGWGDYTFQAYNTNLGHVGTYVVEVNNRFIADVDGGDWFSIECDAGYSYALVLDASENLRMRIINATDGILVFGPFSAGTKSWKCSASGQYCLIIEKTDTNSGSNLYSLSVQRDVTLIVEYPRITTYLLLSISVSAVTVLALGLLVNKRLRSHQKRECQE